MRRAIPKCTKQYLDLVVNPITADSPSQVPDLSTEASLVCRSQLDYAEITNESTIPIVGMFLFLRQGWNDLALAGGEGAAGDAGQVSMGYYGVDADGVLYGPAGAAAAYTGLAFNNVEAMAAQAASLRLEAAGIRLLPTIETVTDSSIRYNSYVIGGQLTPIEILDAVTNSTNIVSALKSSPCAETYGNNSGVCVRYDPFQDEVQLKFQPGQSYWDYNAYNWNAYRTPCIYVQFSQTLPIGDPAPIIVHATAWHEFTVRHPSFLYGQSSPVDVNFSLVRSVMSQCTPTYPIVTSGHSFTTFFATVPTFLNLFTKAVEAGTGVWNTFRASKNVKNTNNVGKGASGKKKKRPKRSKKASQLPGNRKQFQSLRPPRNTR